MSDYRGILAISASGMQAERLRLEVAAHNLANAHSIAGGDGTPYRSLRVLIHAAGPSAFDTKLNGGSVEAAGLRGVERAEVVPSGAEPRLDYDPGSPLADGAGLERTAQVNVAEEMLTVMSSVRAYEANVRAMNAAKAIAMRALDIGSDRL